MARRILVRCVHVLGVTVLVAAFVAVGSAWFAGWRLQVVETESMAPAIPRHSLVVVQPVAPDLIEVGDVVAFHERGIADRTVLHRVTEADVGSDGRPLLRTKGDANNAPDAYGVQARHVVGRHRFHVVRLGAVASALRPPWGTVVLAGVPLLVGALASRRSSRATETVPPASTAPTSPAQPVPAIDPSHLLVVRTRRIVVRPHPVQVAGGN